jgi:hypothetical protein
MIKMNTAQPHRIRKLAEGHRTIQAIIEKDGRCAPSECFSGIPVAAGFGIHGSMFLV